MARGDHPERTPLYGGLLIIAAMLLGVGVTYWSRPPTVLRAIVLVIVGLMMLVGIGMTLRDYSGPPRR